MSNELTVMDFMGGKIDVETRTRVWYGLDNNRTIRTHVKIESHQDTEPEPGKPGVHFVTEWSKHDFEGKPFRIMYYTTDCRKQGQPYLHLRGWNDRGIAYTIPRTSKLWNEVIRALNKIADPIVNDATLIDKFKLEQEGQLLRDTIMRIEQEIEITEHRVAQLPARRQQLADTRAKLREFEEAHPEFAEQA